MGRMTLNGLSSGIDTDAVVKAMLQPYQTKVDSAKKDKVLMEWKKEAWQGINSKILNFHQKFIAPSRLNATFNKKNVTTSHPNLVTIGSGSTVPEGTHTVKVEQLAETARLQTGKVTGDGVTKGTSLKDLGIEGNLEFALKDKDGKVIENIQIDTTDMNIGQLESKLKEKMPDANINFDEKAGAFFVSSKKSGENHSFSIEAMGDSDVKLQKLGLLGSGQTTSKAEGKDSIIKYNGIEIKSESNQVSVNGLNLNLVQADKATEVTLVSVQDKDGIVGFVKDFVSEYNSLMEEVNTLLSAEYSRDYRPLTDAEKEGMTEKEIELWEKKAKTGLLRKDPNLAQFKESMRDILGSVVPGNAFGTLSGIGISTGDWREGGKLHIDEEKLRKAIDQDADAVIELFTAQPSAEKAKAEYEKKNGVNSWDSLSTEEQKKKTSQSSGLGLQMFNTMETMFKSSNEKSKNFLFNDKVLDKKITDSKTRISTLQAKYDKMETYYYKKFAAMEKMMSQYNSQTAFLGQL